MSKKSPRQDGNQKQPTQMAAVEKRTKKEKRKHKVDYDPELGKKCTIEPVKSPKVNHIHRKKEHSTFPEQNTEGAPLSKKDPKRKRSKKDKKAERERDHFHQRTARKNATTAVHVYADGDAAKQHRQDKNKNKKNKKKSNATENLTRTKKRRIASGVRLEDQDVAQDHDHDHGIVCNNMATHLSALDSAVMGIEDNRQDETKVLCLGGEVSRPLTMVMPALVLAPMVGGSELAFRMLTRKHGATLCYTPMMYSSRFATDKTYRDTEFHTHPDDRPLVAHFCGNDPDTMLAAAKLIEKDCDAIDINLGCPQRIAHSGHFGSYLLGIEDRHIVLNMVKRLVQGLEIPVFCKIRLLDAVDDTVRLCRDLAAAGCSLIAVHARYRGMPIGIVFESIHHSGTATRRRDGPAHLDELTQVVKALREQSIRIPILANGNVRCPQDVVSNLQSTHAHGIMSAEGILDDPAIFSSAGNGSGRSLHPHPEEHPIEVLSIPLVTTDSNATADLSHGKAKRKIVKKIREIERLQAKLETPDEAGTLTADERHKISRLSEYTKKLHTLENANPSSPHNSGTHSTAPAVAALTHASITSAATTTASSARAVKHGTSFSTAETALPESSLLAEARRVRLAREYLDLCVAYPSATHAMKIFHVRRMCREPFDRFQLLDDCCSAETHEALCGVVDQCLRYIAGMDTFVYDADKHTRALAAVARRKLERQKRKTFEGRMTRKAKREGKPLDFYLKLGLSPPSHKDIVTFKTLHRKDPKAATTEWRQQFSQHCFAFHCLSGGLPGDGGCTRGGRACAFLHMEIMDSIADAQPSWLDEATT